MSYSSSPEVEPPMDLVGLPVDRFLERVASREPAPGGGAVAAVTVAAAAALVAMVARFSDDMGDPEGPAAEADALRTRSCALAESDARSYTAVLAAYRLPRADAETRREKIRSALEHAADVPLEIVACAHEVGRLGARLYAEGNRNLRGDAVTAVNLADAGARSAAHLVELNVRLGDLGTERSDRAAAWCADLREAVQAVDEDRT